MVVKRVATFFSRFDFEFELELILFDAAFNLGGILVF